MTDQLAEPNSDAVLMQFNRLIEQLLSGNLHRTTFRPWEIGILVDLATCDLPTSSKWESVLRDYQATAQRQMQAGARLPLKLSEYVESLQANLDPPSRKSRPLRSYPYSPNDLLQDAWRPIER